LVWVLGDTDGDAVVFDRDGRATLGPVRYRIVVLRNPHSPVDTEGRSLGVFAMSPGTYRLAAQVESYASGTFRAGIPAGYLRVQTPGLTSEAATELKTRWMAAHGGDRRSIAVLNATTEFQPLNLSPVDAALDQVKRLNMADVAFSFGLDPMTLGVGLQNSATYTNLRDAWANHRDFGLAPWTAAVEDALSALLPGVTSVRVNLDGFANPTAAERYAAWQVAITAGIVTVDEVRAAEGLPELDTPAPEPAPPPPALEPAPPPDLANPTDNPGGE
jgi:phage portal protein BeeE